MRKNVFTKFLASAVVVLSALFVGCNTEDVTFESPEITVSQSVISDAPQAGGTVALTVETNRAWRVVVPDDVDWIKPAPGFGSGEGSGTIKLDLLPNQGFDREATVKISTTTVYAAVRIVQPGTLTKTDLYEDNFNLTGTPVAATTTIADYTGWNKKGLGSANVTYTGTGCDIRSSVQPSPTTPNNIFFPAAGGDFIVHNIGKGVAEKLTLDFETSSYNDFNADQLKVSISTADAPDTWTEATVVRSSNTGGNKWVATKAVFTASTTATQINIKFTGKDVRIFNLNVWAEGIIDMPKVPVVTTDDATQITKTSASITGKFTYDGTGTIDEVGVAYCKSSDSPQTFTNVAAAPKPAPGATFTVALTPLVASTEYLYKSYVKIGEEYYYGQQKSFSTELGGTLLLDETFGLTSSNNPPLADFTGLETTGVGASTTLVTGTKGVTAMNVSVRVSGTSAGYTGASGGCNAYFGGNEAIMYLYNIGIGNATSFNLSFGMQTASSNATGNDWDAAYMAVSYSTDNITWKPITYTRGAAGKGWALTTATITGVDAGAPTISLKFAAGIDNIRVDDVMLTCATEGIAPAQGVKMTGAEAKNVDITTATAEGTYTAAGGTPTETGVYYRKVSEPTLVKAAATGIASPISVALTGLTAETDYIFIPYAIVGSVTYYGPVATFSTKSAAPATLITIATLRAKTLDAVLDANEKVEGVVISDKSTLSIDPKSLIIQNGTDAGSGITVRFAAAHNFVMGDKVSVFIDGGKVTKYSEMVQFTPKTDAEVTKISTEALPAPVAVTPATLNDFQSMLVKVEGCQVIAADMSAALSTVPTMVTNSGGEFNIYVASGATFKAEIIPSGMGTAIGIAGINKTTLQLQPRSMTDLNGLSGTRFMTLGTPVFSATTIKQGEAIVDGKITIPYSDAASADSFTGVGVAVSGAGSAGITPVSGATVSYATGSGNIEISITGTPSAAGAVTFTISGITGLGTTTCTGTVGGAGAESIIEVDFSQQANYPAGFPSAATKDVATYIFAGQSFVFSGGTVGNGYYKGASSSYLMIGQTNSYIELPAISGKTLTKVVLTSTSGVSASARVAVKATDANTVVGEEQVIKVATPPYEIIYPLSGTVANTAYRLYVTNGYNAQIAKLSLTYTE